MRAFLIAGALLAVAGCAGQPSQSFTWLDGQQYRWLNDLSACANDGSAVFFQRATADGTFIEPHGLTPEKCARAQQQGTAS
ncbi:MAG: hypothetical protein VW999_09680 [Alphaproteobacteria bacterium]